jgi:hypothetical protein
MNEQEKETLSAIIFQASTIRLLTDDKQVLKAVDRIETLVHQTILSSWEPPSLKA